MACRDNQSNLCIDSFPSTCLDHVGDLGENTTITSSCVSQYDVNKDLYTITDNIITSLDLTDINNLCLTYPQIDGKVQPKTAIIKNAEEICSLIDRVQELENKDFANLDITGFNLNYQCLVDPCGDPISSLGQLLQIMINSLCLSGVRVGVITDQS